MIGRGLTGSRKRALRAKLTRAPRWLSPLYRDPRAFLTAVLTILGIVVAIRANQYIGNQNALIAAEQVPQVRVNIALSQDSMTGFYSLERLDVKFLGGYVESPKVDDVEILEITRRVPDGFVRHCWRPVKGYYFVQHLALQDDPPAFWAEGAGGGEGNRRKFVRLDEEFRALSADGLGSIAMHVYVRVSYSDAFGNLHVAYYGEDGERLPFEEGEAIFSYDWDAWNAGRALYWDELDAQTLNDAFEADYASSLTTDIREEPWVY